MRPISPALLLFVVAAPVLVMACSGSDGRQDVTAAGAGGASAGSGGSTPGSGGSTPGSGGSTPGSGGSTPGSGGSTPGSGGSGVGSGGSTPGSGGSTVSSGGSTAAGGNGGSTAGSGGSGKDAAAGSGGSAPDSGVPADGPALSAVLVPAQGVLLGAYYGALSMSATDTMIGRKLNIHLVYYAWTDDWTKGAASDLADGRIPLVNWEPAGIDFNNIVSGSLDATIKARATGAKALGKPFFLDFAAEMNGDEAWSGNNAPLYVNAYKHIHDLFVAAGATNVVWAWCPNVTDVNGGNKNTLDYYPGDSYVDWTGVDGYNWGGADWQSFQQVFAGIYPILASKKKPILIGEMSSAEQGGNKGQWIDGIIPALKTSYPLIKGLVWFDINKENDWRIASSTASRDAFIRMANDPYMNP
jgi:hypothetical protein